jgi:hypothetical protein
MNFETCPEKKPLQSAEPKVHFISLTSVASYSLLVAGCWLLVAGCWLLVAGCWLLVAGCWLLVAGCWLRSINN